MAAAERSCARTRSRSTEARRRFMTYPYEWNPLPPIVDINRDSAIALRDYIASTDRKVTRRKKWQTFLMNVPTHFLTASVRQEAVKKLERLLE